MAKKGYKYPIERKYRKNKIFSFVRHIYYTTEKTKLQDFWKNTKNF